MDPYLPLMTKSGLDRAGAIKLRLYGDKVMRATMERHGVFWYERFTTSKNNYFMAAARRDALRIIEATVRIQDLKLTNHAIAELLFLEDHSSVTRIRQKAYAGGNKPITLDEYRGDRMNGIGQNGNGKVGNPEKVDTHTT